VSPFLGFVNLEDGIFSVDGMTPMGAGLHEPDWICCPLVIGKLGTVKQKLIKLFVEVSEATWPKNSSEGRIAFETETKNNDLLRGHLGHHSQKQEQ